MDSWTRKHLGQLVGSTIEALAEDPSDDEAHGFVARMPDGSSKIVFVLCDPEGNGPGWLEISDGDQAVSDERPDYGVTCDCGKPGVIGCCPFDQDVHGKETECNCCDECAEQCRQDI